MLDQYSPSDLKILWRIVETTCFVRMPLATAPGECWVSIRPHNPLRWKYPKIYVDGQHREVHAIAYDILVGPIPPGYVHDHLCRVPACWRPSHLESVTNGENVLRGFGPPAMNARKTHCKRGHAFTKENTYVRPSGHRNCRICTRVKSILLTPVA